MDWRNEISATGRTLVTTTVQPKHNQTSITRPHWTKWAQQESKQPDLHHHTSATRPHNQWAQLEPQQPDLYNQASATTAA